MKNSSAHGLDFLRSHIVRYDLLKDFLQNKGSGLSYSKEDIRYFIENDEECWELWNRVRWDTALENQGAGIREVKEYLGEEFKVYTDTSWAIAKAWNKINPKSNEEIADFYRNNNDYILNLLIWHESGDRGLDDDYLKGLVEKYDIHSVLDFGCGIGTDGLRFLELGTSVSFADFECPSVDFLRWRLKKRKIGEKAQILNVDTLKKYPKADMFWAIDVLEHMPNPLEIFDNLDDSCKVFAHRSMFNDTAGGRHPCHLNFNPQQLNKILIKKGFSLRERHPVELWTRS